MAAQNRNVLRAFCNNNKEMKLAQGTN